MNQKGIVFRLQSLPDNMKPIGNGKSVIQTECHINQIIFTIRRSLLVTKNCHIKQLSYYHPVSYYPGGSVPITHFTNRQKELRFTIPNFEELTHLQYVFTRSILSSMSLSFLKFQKNSKPFEAFYRVTCQLESYIMLTSKQKFSHSIDSLYKNANFNLMSTEYRAQADGSHCMCIRTDNIDIQGRVCIRSSCSLVEDINFLSKWECTTTIDLQASFVTSLTHLTLNHLEIVRRKGPLTVMLFLPRCNPLPGV